MTPQARRERAEQVVTRVCNWYEGHQADSQALRDELIGELLAFAAHEVEQAVARERVRCAKKVETMWYPTVGGYPSGPEIAAALRREGAGDDPKPDPLDGFRPDLSR